MKFVKVSSRNALIIISLSAVAFLAVCSVARNVHKQMDLVARDSAQLALFTEIVEKLEEFKSKHGGYPETLDALALTYPDGGDQSLLKLFRYETDGAKYSLFCVRIYTHEEMEAHSTHGRPHIEYAKPSAIEKRL